MPEKRKKPAKKPVQRLSRTKGGQKKKREKFVPPIFEHQKARSRASKKAWETRWERSTGPVGPKGKAYLESVYGADFREYDVAVVDVTYEETGKKKKYPTKKK